MDVSRLGVVREIAHLHVLDHASPKGCHGKLLCEMDLVSGEQRLPWLRKGMWNGKERSSLNSARAEGESGLSGRFGLLPRSGLVQSRLRHPVERSTQSFTSVTRTAIRGVSPGAGNRGTASTSSATRPKRRDSNIVSYGLRSWNADRWCAKRIGLQPLRKVGFPTQVLIRPVWHNSVSSRDRRAAYFSTRRKAPVVASTAMRSLASVGFSP